LCCAAGPHRTTIGRAVDGGEPANDEGRIKVSAHGTISVVWWLGDENE
jgi:hypothetical protein